MQETHVIGMCEGTCGECNQQRKGVRFRFDFGSRVQSEFLCWEHFRFLQEAMKPQRLVVHEVHEICGCSCCCCHRHTCGCSRRSYTICRNESRTVSYGQSSGVSYGRSMSESRGQSESEGRSSTQTDGTSESRSESQ